MIIIINCRSFDSRVTLRSIPLAAVIVSLCLTALGESVRGDATPAHQKMPTIEGITEYRLDNGLRILLFADSSTSAVTVNLTVLVGSRHEGYGETGMAHLLEHMLFKGTPRHPDVPKALRDHGARFNGTTWVDRTNYFETMPAKDENLEFAIDLEADRLVNSFVKREDLVSEMTVVRNEFEAGENNPEGILSQRMLAVAYEWHNYGKSTIGNRSDIERVPIENLQAFYRKYYQPDNAVLVIAGNFNESKALSLIGKYFGVLKRSERKPQETYTEEPPQDGERTVVLRRVGKVAVVGAIYHICAGSHEDYPAVDVLNEILVSEPAGRLYKALVESKLADRVTGTAFSWHDPGVLEITAQLSGGKPLELVREALVNTVENFAAQPVTQEEVERGKRRLLKEIDLLLTNSNQVGTVLSQSIAVGDWRLLFLQRDRLAKVTPEEVTRVAKHYLKQSNRTIGLYIPTTQPERTEIPPTPNVAEVVRSYQRSQTVAQGEAFDPTPQNIEKRVQRSQLPCGVKVALLRKKTRGEMAHLELTLRYGNKKSLRGYTSAAGLLAELMTRGTKKHTRQQLQDDLDKLKARVSTGTGGLGLASLLLGAGSGGQVTFSIECPRDNLPAVLGLLGEMLREPTFPPEEFDVLKRQVKSQLEKQLTEPLFVALNLGLRQLHPYPKDDVRYLPSIEESIARMEMLTVDKVRQLYQQQLGGQVGELVVVGDFDQAATPKLVQDILKDWKSSVAYQRIEQQAHTEVAGEEKVIDTPDKANAVFFGGQALAMTDTDPDYPPLKIADYIFGEAPLSSRLSNRVRGKEGLSYAVASHLRADALDKAGLFIIFAITNPNNIGKVDKAIAEELDKMIKSGVTEQELAEAKKAYFEQFKVQCADDRMLTFLLGSALHAGRTFTYYSNLQEKITALAPQQVSDAFRKYVQPKRLVTVQAGDFKTKK
jgi:zinc protease